MSVNRRLFGVMLASCGIGTIMPAMSQPYTLIGTELFPFAPLYKSEAAPDSLAWRMTYSNGSNDKVSYAILEKDVFDRMSNQEVVHFLDWNIKQDLNRFNQQE